MYSLIDIIYLGPKNVNFNILNIFFQFISELCILKCIISLSFVGVKMSIIRNKLKRQWLLPTYLDAKIKFGFIL